MSRAARETRRRGGRPYARRRARPVDDSTVAGDLSAAARDVAPDPPTAPSRARPRRPRRTSGRHHSTATGGCGERLCHRDAERLERLLLGSAPDDAEVRQLARPALEEVALAALGLEQRHAHGPEAPPRAGSPACRRQSPRRPPGPLSAPTSGRPRSASSSSTRRASPRSRIAGQAGCGDERRQPPVEHVHHSGRLRAQTSASARDDHHVPVRLGALARRLDLGVVLERLVDDLPLHRCHRLERDARARSQRPSPRTGARCASTVAVRRAR